MGIIGMSIKCKGIIGKDAIGIIGISLLFRPFLVLL